VWRGQKGREKCWWQKDTRVLTKNDTYNGTTSQQNITYYFSHLYCKLVQWKNEWDKETCKCVKRSKGEKLEDLEDVLVIWIGQVNTKNGTSTAHSPWRWQLQRLPKHWINFNIRRCSSPKTEGTQTDEVIEEQTKVLEQQTTVTRFVHIKILVWILLHKSKYTY
jgi:hypothetical protein